MPNELERYQLLEGSKFAVGGGRTHDEMKFDRQVRLWGEHGQKRLRLSHLLILGSSVTIVEMLRNLVLPNVGAYTIVDNTRVKEADVRNNFYFKQSDIGQYRAATIVTQLIQHNPNVRANDVPDPVCDYLSKMLSGGDGLEFVNDLSKYTAVVLDPRCVPTTLMSKLDLACHELNIPLVTTCSVGWIGVNRVSVRERIVMQTHPDAKKVNLGLHWRYLQRFPTLVSYALSHRFDVLDYAVDADIPEPTYDITWSVYPPLIHTLSAADRSSVRTLIPYPVLLIRAVYRMKNLSYTQPFPDLDRNDAALLRQTLKSMMLEEEENFKQALAHVNTVCSEYTYEKDFLDIINDGMICGPEDDKFTTPAKLPGIDKTDHIPALKADVNTPNGCLWVALFALRKYLCSPTLGNGYLPVVNALPDMVSHTVLFNDLRAIYYAHACLELDAYVECIKEVSAITAWDNSVNVFDTLKRVFQKDNPFVYICDNAEEMRLNRTTPLVAEFSTGLTDVALSMCKHEHHREMVKNSNGASLREYIEDVMEDGVRPNTILNHHWYLAYRAMLQFRDLRNRLPGSSIQSLSMSPQMLNMFPMVRGSDAALTSYQQDFDEFSRIFEKFHGILLEGVDVDTKALRVLVDMHSAEVHTVAATTGAQAADLLLKVCIGQFSLPNNTVLINSYNSTGSVFQL